MSGHQLAALCYRGSHFFSLLSAHCTASLTLLCCGHFPPPQGCWMQMGEPSTELPVPPGCSCHPPAQGHTAPGARASRNAALQPLISESRRRQKQPPRLHPSWWFSFLTRVPKTVAAISSQGLCSPAPASPQGSFQGGSTPSALLIPVSW